MTVQTQCADGEESWCVGLMKGGYAPTLLARPGCQALIGRLPHGWAQYLVLDDLCLADRQAHADACRD